MGSHNRCLQKMWTKKPLTMELLGCVLIEGCAVVRSNMVVAIFTEIVTMFNEQVKFDYLMMCLKLLNERQTV